MSEEMYVVMSKMEDVIVEIMVTKDSDLAIRKYVDLTAENTTNVNIIILDTSGKDTWIYLSEEE